MEETQIHNETNILTRVISPKNGDLTAEVAGALLGLTFPDTDIERMNELAEKNRQGDITEEEREEMESYSRVGNLLNLLQSKARRSIPNG